MIHARAYERSILALFLTLALTCPADPAPPENAQQPVQREKVSFGHRLLYYVPNRILDVVDLLRLRGRVGPGLAAGLRVTEYASFYGGTYRSVYAGLPGPRYPEKFRWPFGREELKGIVFCGVDATDDTSHGPGYSATEMIVGAHLLLVGLDVGMDPVELGDLLAGLLMFDPRGDDL